MKSMTKPKFIADADLDEDLIRGLFRAEPGVDFLTAAQGGTRGLTDREIIELAVATGRVIVSHDRSTMTAEFYRFLNEGHSSPGLIIVRQTADEGQVIYNLRVAWAASFEADRRDQVTWVPM
jgi:predicted nuclease of predicted toxin-antitoxin system